MKKVLFLLLLGVGLLHGDAQQKDKSKIQRFSDYIQNPGGSSNYSFQVDLTVTGTYNVAPTTMVGQGGFLFVSGPQADPTDSVPAQLLVLDRSDPNLTNIVSAVNLPDLIGINPVQVRMVAQGGFLHMIADEQLSVISVEDPINPVLVSTVTTFTGTPQDISIDGYFDYVVTDSGILYAINYADIQNPVVCGTCDLSVALDQPNTQSYAVSIHKKYAYIRNDTNDGNLITFACVSIQNPYEPVLVGFNAEVNNVTSPNPSSIAIHKNLAFVGAEQSVLDIADPTAPYVVGTPNWGGALPLTFIQIQGPFVFGIDTQGNLNFFDLTNLMGIGLDFYIDNALGNIGCFAVEGLNLFVGAYDSVAQAGYLRTYNLYGDYTQQLEVGHFLTDKLKVNSAAYFDSHIMVDGGGAFEEGFVANDSSLFRAPTGSLSTLTVLGNSAAPALTVTAQGVQSPVQLINTPLTTDSANLVIEPDGTVKQITSSERFLQNMGSLSATDISNIYTLSPITFSPTMGVSGTLGQYGLTAESVALVYPQAVSYDAQNNPVSVQQGQLTALLVAAVQDLNNRYNQLAALVNSLNQ